MTVPSQPLMMRPQQLGELFVELQRRGHRLMGPRLRDGAIVYADLDAATELPIGWTDRQEAGHYRVQKRDDEARFGYVVGPHSWKQIGLPMRRRLWRAERDDAGGFAVQADEAPDEKLALIGVRACELAAFDVQDKVLRDGPFRDTFYSARRANMFIVSVNCTEPGGTCFCTSMDTGPRCRSGFDINLPELPAHASGHVLIATAGTDVGREVLAALQLAPADA
ncbi:MAG: sulfite reductase subunit A, partial [Planctomycetota bacterium]